VDVLLKKGRCDMFLPIGDDTTDDEDDQGNVPTLRKALTELLESSNILSNTIIAATGGDDIILYKLCSNLDHLVNQSIPTTRIRTYHLYSRYS